jgi:GT2 family glycosyltransferase
VIKPLDLKLSYGAQEGTIRLAVLITCFNRRDLTLRCLDALFAQDRRKCDMQVFLIDDASTDGTSQAVKDYFPGVHLTFGTGKLFWNRGMHAAFALALRQDFDYYLWLNDDTLLAHAGLDRMLQTSERLRQQGVSAIVAGNTQDSITQQHTYGGMVRGSRMRPASYRLAQPSFISIEPCDTMNGNCTLVPREIASIIGNLDYQFNHNFGDIDYGLRARASGFSIYMAPGFIGSCSENTDRGTWKDRNIGLRKRWSLLNSPKGCPWAEWSIFTKRHLGRTWILYALSPYVKVVFQSIIKGRL